MTVVVVGAGQAGLSVSRELGVRGVEHVVLERSRVAQAWRDRWDSFTLVTPNWTLDLPGSPYTGDDSEGHVSRDEIVDYFERYAKDWSVPIRAGVRVDALVPGAAQRFCLHTSDGELDADVVVVCTGSFQRQHRPPGFGANGGPQILDTADYRNPAAVPDGKVLLIGSGQTGCQLAEELRLAGRDVFLSCGRAPWYPRRLDGEDTVTWLHRIRLWDQRLDDLPSPVGRLIANPQTTGHDGGHDLHFRVLQQLGVALLGRLEGIDGSKARFKDDLGDSVAFGDKWWTGMCQQLSDRLPGYGYAVPELEPIPPFKYEPTTELDLREFGAVILTAGFRPDYSWIKFPACDEIGFPLTTAGTSTRVPGLYFCGVHFMRVRRSGFVFGVGIDATLVAQAIADREPSLR